MSKYWKKDPVIIVTVLLIIAVCCRVILTLLNLFAEYIYILDIFCWRLLFLALLIAMYRQLAQVPFFIALKKELEIMEEGPANKSWVMALLRKWNFILLIMGYMFYFLATYFAEQTVWSNLLGFMSLVFLTLYCWQLVVHLECYIRRSFTSNKVTSNVGVHVQKRTMFTKAAVLAHSKEAAVVCWECLKGVVALCASAEMAYKAMNGMNSVSPPRNALLNSFHGTNKQYTEGQLFFAAEKRAHEYNNSGVARPKAEAEAAVAEARKVLKRIIADAAKK